MRFISTYIAYVLATAVQIHGTKLKCKCAPEDKCWPIEAQWFSLNQSLNGALIRGVPPGSVCYPDQPNYNAEACNLVASQWFDSTWHASNPVSIDYPIWTNNSCNPTWQNGTSVTGDTQARVKGCSIGRYPAYVINATSSSQVATALTWAAKHNIRVVIKSTGHSYTGRSTGFASLSIWTHHLHGIEYIPDFRPTSCPVDKPLKGARIAAGHTGIEVLTQLAEHDSVAITGANADVGLVGWLTGGGHGPLSQSYGMGADNLLEATIVTVTGDVLTTNPCQHADLFSAIRGGGGGTFGVVTEMIVKAYPSPKTVSHTLKIMSLDGRIFHEFYELMGFVHGEMHRLKEGGMQGYYYIGGPPVVPTLSFAWTFMAFDTPREKVEGLMKPMEKYLNERKHLFAYSQDVKEADTYLDIYGGKYPKERVATGNSAYGSRLMSPESLSDPKKTAELLARVGPSANASQPNAPYTNPIVIGHMIASPNTPSYFPSTISLNPSWRKTLVHLIVTSSFPDGSPQSLADAVYADITHNKTAAMRKMSPDTGAYYNEADAFEEGWQESFWGDGYEKLKGVKEKYDLGNMLWCRRCVGSERLEEVESGKLCLPVKGLEKEKERSEL